MLFGLLAVLLDSVLGDDLGLADLNTLVELCALVSAFPADILPGLMENHYKAEQVAITNLEKNKLNNVWFHKAWS